MSLLRNHIVLMAIYAALVSVFFALLWKEEKRERIIFVVKVFVALFVGAIVIAWVMYGLTAHFVPPR